MRSVFALLLLFLSVLPVSAVELPLVASAQVVGQQVLLSDLLAPRDAERLAQISGPLRLLRAPEPGATRKVNRQTLARLVERQVPTAQLHLGGAESVTITRKGVWIEPVEIEAALQAYLDRASAKLPGVRLSFTRLRLPARFQVASGQIKHQVIPARPEVIGSRRLTLITRVNDQVVENQSIPVEISARAEVLVATADLRRGDRLDESTLMLQSRDISRLDEPFFRFTSIEGKFLKQSVRNGQPLLRRQVDFPPLVKRGDRVTIQLKKGEMQLTAHGEARENGELGETIRVRNTGSLREIRGQVAAAGLIKVEL